ncbi:hypothetical protein D1AOALGA4SA_476 [Olavius algarvensis Delta 1 endosymbiont]|nr:hypothetical protein D1AOALGA4SA_476 [Olavius algarvensis Delta 1 endosymbiont]
MPKLTAAGQFSSLNTFQIILSALKFFPLEWTHKRKNSHYISMIR